MIIDLSQKWALVTGGGRGIGRGCARALARCGANIVLNDRPDSPDLAAACDEILELEVECRTVEADVFSRGGCEQLVEQSIELSGGLDMLVSNPAFGVRCSFLEYDPQDFERVIQATLISGFHMTQLVARHLVDQQRRGKIVLISSVQAEMPMALSCAYGAAKSGLNVLARTASVELSQHRINVNAIQPGWIDTPGEHVAFSEEVIRREGERLPWGRLGTPDDIGNMAAFLCSDAADYVTGSVVSVDGGFRYKDCRDQTLIPSRE